MDRVEAEEAPRVPALVVEPEERHVLVLVMLIAGTLGGRVRKIRERRPVDVPVQYRRVADTELAWRKAVVCALDREDCTGDDRICALLDVPERSNLREKVLKVPAYAAVLVRRDERDVVVVV